MRIFRFMNIAEFRNYLNGEPIEGKFVKGKACFLEESIPAREKEASIRQLTDLTSLKFKSTDFEGQMKELTELISPIFMSGDCEGQLKKMEHLTLADFMSKVREGVTAEVLVEFETTDAFEQECDKVIMAYQQYLIQEIQANGYSIETLHCVSYRMDLINRFKNGIGVDTITKNMFEGVEHTLEKLEHEERLQKKNLESKPHSIPTGKSGLIDCMKDNSVRISTQQEATHFVKTAAIDEEQKIDTKELNIGD